MPNQDRSTFEVDRREFLRLTLMSSAMLMASGTLMEAAADTTPSLPPSFAAFRPLTPGSVRPEGWLRLYLEKQAAELGSQLPQISWPFTEAYWSGEEQGESWWPWEQKAYWIDGATRLALVLGDQRLLEQVETTIRYTLEHADADGYLGPHFFKEPTGGFHRWPHTIFFRSLAAASDAGRNPSAVEALHKHYLQDKADYGTPTRNITNVEDILWCYERTGDKRLLDMAENAWREFSRVTSPGGDGGDLSALRVFAATPIDSHGVTYIETAKQPAILYLHTGNPEYLKFALAAQRRIFDHHMLIDGIPSTSEFYRTRTSLDSHETCDITDHTWSWGYMLMATGDGVWADRVERACLNAGFGAIKKDWKALQYFSCPNQFLATLNSDHNVMEHGGRKMAFQPNPGQRTACCGGDVHRLFPNYVIRMWMKDTHGGLAAVLYGPSRLKTTLGEARQEVEIVQETDYPFDERIHFTIHTAQAIQFPLSLRIPAWCDAPRIQANGKPVKAQTANGFATLNRRFSPGDTVTLTLPMKAAVSRWPQNGIGVEHGPLVYSLPIKANWAPVVEAKFTTPEFPSWNATPESPWNYGLAVDAEHLPEQVKVHRKAMTQDPWTDPPVTLTVPAKAVEDWKLQQNPDDASQRFTPPLPDLGTAKVAAAEEQITLAPYGSTHLRVTIFPDLRKS
jgi:hypothetical protein